MRKILDLYKIEVFFLIFMRMTGFLIINPLFGRQNVPRYIKIGFSFLLAIIMYNTVDVPGQSYGSGMYSFIRDIILEFITGFVLGFISYTVFNAIYVAGQLIDMQIGFGMVNVLDPVSNIQVPLTSNFYFIMSMIVFFILNGHHNMIRNLFESYKHIPLGNASFDYGVISKAAEVFGNVFVLGFRIAAPVTAAIIITEIALGVISKTIPQFNLFVVGIPLKIAIGLIVMIITIPIFVELLDVLFSDMNREVTDVIKKMAEGIGI